MTHDPEDGAVGFKRPPKEHQFKPGHSGNPSGRRKRPPTFASDLADELREPITLHEKGQERRITKQRAFIKTLTALAIKGDIRAINALVACARNFAPEEATSKGEELDPEDLEILEDFVRRKRHTKQAAPAEENPLADSIPPRKRK
jgi:Family of unknown function (DUF5681)